MSGRARPAGASPLELARTLIRADTVNPPGREEPSARLLAERLAAAGLDVELVPHGAGRAGLIAMTRPPVGDNAPWLCLTGHLDTVPFSADAWSRAPLGAEIDGDRLYGRGSSDMKAAVAALVTAIEAAASRARPRAGVVLALTAGEETGCEGAAAVAARLPEVGAVLVGEPTANRVVTAHKGATWFACEARGVAAHGSAPERGRSAIRAMVHALGGLESAAPLNVVDPRLGSPTVNVGTIAGGAAVNVVPDRCEATIDVRTVPGLDGDVTERWLRAAVGADIDVRRLVDLPPVATPASDPWVAEVTRAFAAVTGERPAKDAGAVGYFTDASVLAPALGDPPVVLCGPGEPEQAHQRDEWCSITRLEGAAAAYAELCLRWCGDGPIGRT